MIALNLKRALFALCLLLPVTALAQTAIISRDVNVRAGPDRAFPLVTWFRAGTMVRVFGCTSGWRWCDVASGRSRGWVHSQYLTNQFRGRPPVISFSVGPYWDLHYRGRPWYGSRSGWDGWGSPSFRPPPPRGRPRG